MHWHISFYLQTTADQQIICIATFHILHTNAVQHKICTAIFHFIYRELQTKKLYALPHFILFQKMQNNWIYALTDLIVFKDKFRTTEYSHCNFSLYLKKIAVKLLIFTAIIHCIYRQLQTNWLYELTHNFYLQKLQTNSKYACPHFIVFTDNCRQKEFMHWHISLYLQTTENQTILCTSTFHFIYRQL